MLISPPFLPQRHVAGSATSPPWSVWDDEPAGAAWFERAMACATASGGRYLLGRNLAWHGGVHLRAPVNAQGVPEPVRAIAAGRVAYVRAPRLASTSSGSGDPQAAYGGWTDSGCVVLRHETEIGEGRDADVEFYSIYMHLSRIDASVALDTLVSRKSVLGQPGRICGAGLFIQLDIVCDDMRVAQLMGAPGRDLLRMDGRTDALYGDTHYVLPAGTPAYARLPQRDDDCAPNGITELPSLKIEEDLVLSLGLAHGNCTRRLRRRVEGPGMKFELLAMPRAGSGVEPGYEYGLHAHAMRPYALPRERDKTSPMQSRLAPVAQYELSRFGRVLTTISERQRASLAHLQAVPLPSGTVWVDLSQAPVRVCSDADFPPWTEWRRVSDGNGQSSRCDSPTILSWLGNAASADATRGDVERALSDQQVRRALDRTVCLFPTEWDGGPGFEARWSWLMKTSPGNPEPMNEDDFNAFCRHATSLTFWEHAHLPLPARHWHFHPREFIRHFRRCGWLSRAETTTLIPRKSIAAGAVTWSAARNRFDAPERRGRVALPDLDVAIARTCRRYGLLSPLRQAHFFAQILQETGAMSDFREKGDSRYFRKLYEVISEEEAGAEHDAARRSTKREPGICSPPPGRSASAEPKCMLSRDAYVAKRVADVRRKAAGLGNVRAGDGARFCGRGLIQLSGRSNYTEYGNWRGQDFTEGENPDRIESEPELIADAAGRYWVSRRTKLGVRIVEASQEGIRREVIETITRAVNGGLSHQKNREEYFKHAWSQLNDCPETEPEGRCPEGVEVQRPDR